MSKDRDPQQKKMSYCIREGDQQHRLPHRQRSSDEYYFTSVTKKQSNEHRQEVNCLTQNREQLVVYLPPYLPHNLAVKAVEDILDMKYYQIENKSLNLTFRKTSAAASSPYTHVADVHRKNSLQEYQRVHSATGER